MTPQTKPNQSPAQQSPTGFLPFALPDIDDAEINAVAACMRSGWMTSGPKTREFEANFAAFINEKNNLAPVTAVAVNSATAGLIIALEALGIGAGDEVITTCYTFSATAMSIVHVGATPVLVDIDPTTMNIDVNEIAKKITSRTKAIIPVHFAGLACDMDSIIKLAKTHNLKIIEDAAHALPTIYQNQLIGALDTDATIYSFYATKTITTGEGGMIVSRHQNLIKRAQIMRIHGISTDAFDRYTSNKPKWYYEITAAGYKCNLTDIAASIGVEQLKKSYDFQKKRAAIAIAYREAFKDLPITLPMEAAKDDLHAQHLFVIGLPLDIDRNEFINKMASDHQIGCSVHFIPLNLHPYWQQKLGVTEKDFGKAVARFEKAVSLPIYTKMTHDDVDRVIAAVRLSL